MTKFVYKNLFGNNNYAGPCGNWKPKGVVIHNTAGSYNGGSDSASYMNTYLPGIIANGTADNSFTHYYCDKDLIFQCCDTRYDAQHTANTEGNMNYVGYKVCKPGNKEDFLANEQATFKQVAKDMAFWGLTSNRNTVKLHQQFFSTACPWLSVKYHGGPQATQDYFISQIKKYMANNDKEVDETPKPPKNPTYWYYSKVRAVKVLRDVEVHKIQSLSQSKVIGTIKAGKEVKVLSIWKEGNQKHDMSRLKIQYKGKTAWITGNAYYVESCYYLTGNGKKIKTLKDTYAYSASNLTGKKEHVKKVLYYL